MWLWKRGLLPAAFGSDGVRLGGDGIVHLLLAFRTL
jgi:hypothetical protein